MSQDTLKDIITESAKASPPVAVVTAGLASGWTLNSTLTALTILYVVLQIAWLLWQWNRARTSFPTQRDQS